MNYGENISGAFWIALRNPYLWFFGLFVVGSGSTITLSNQNGNFGPSRGLLRFAENNLAAIIIVGIVLLVLLAVISIALNIISQAGLVASVAALRGGRTSSFSATWRSGTRNFWRMLGLRIVLLLIGVLLFFLILTPAVLAGLLIFNLSKPGVTSVTLVVVVALLTIALLILIFIPFSVIGALATRDLVLGEGRVFGSLGGGYDLFRSNIGKSLLVWLIQIGIAIAIGILFALVTFALVTFAVGFPVSSLLSPLLVGFSLGDILLVAGALLVFSLPFLILGAAVGTFYHAYWTLAYLQFRRESDNLPTTEDG